MRNARCSVEDCIRGRWRSGRVPKSTNAGNIPAERKFVHILLSP